MSIRSPNKGKRLHVCVLGDAGTGKSALVTSFCTNRSPSSCHQPLFRKPAKTVAMDYAAKRVEFDVEEEDDGRTEKLSLEICITDFSGNDSYKDARYATYDDSGLVIDAFLVVVSKNRDPNKSLHLVQSKWFEEIARYTSSKVQQTRHVLPPCVCLCFHNVDDDENKIQIDDAFLERSRDALDAFDRRLLTVSSMSFSKSTARTCENASSLIPIELASFVSCANAKTGLNVKSTFERLAKRALKRREKERF